MRLIAITSPATDAGKTFIATGLAEGLARRGIKTLFIDLDLAVGDSIRVFGLADEARQPHPTVSSWRDFPDPWKSLLTGPGGVMVIPRPENNGESVTEVGLTQIIAQAEKTGIEAVVLDLGADVRAPFWDGMIERADVPFLVLDTDAKALDRARRFLAASMQPPEGWILVVNQRTPRGGYRQDEMVRNLGAASVTQSVVAIPYIPENRRPTIRLPVDIPSAGELAEIAMGRPLVELKGGKSSKMSFLARIFSRKASPEIQNDEEPFVTPFRENKGFEGISSPMPTEAISNRKALLLGRAQSLAATLENLGWDTTFYERDDYDVALADPATFKRIPREKQTLIIGAGMDLFFSSDQLAHESAIPVANENAVVAILQERFGGALPRRQSVEIPDSNMSEHSISPSADRKKVAGVVVGFYSGAQGYQGKTVLALNTAALLASEGHPVCLVDLDTDKAGLTTLCGWNERTVPPVDLRNAVESSTGVVKGPGGVHVITAPLDYPGWSPTPIQINNLLGKLVAQYPYVVLDFGARVASPSTIAALKQCGIVFIVSTPFRGALSAVARFRSKEMAEIGGNKVRAIINRVGADGAMTPRDAAAILGFVSAYSTVPEDSAFVVAETKALDGKKYIPPVLGKCEAKKAVKGLVEEIQKSQGVMV